MQKQPRLLATMTGEPFQPVRLRLPCQPRRRAFADPLGVLPALEPPLVPAAW